MRGCETTPRLLRVLYLAKTDRTGPSSRYRIYQYLPHLSARQLDVTVAPLLDGEYVSRRNLGTLGPWLLAYAIKRYLGRLRELLGSSRFDLVVVQDQLFPYLPAIAEQWLLARTGFVLELDDAIYLNPTLTALHERKLSRLARSARAVIVGNTTLAQFVADAGGRPIVIPTVIDVERYPIAQHEERSPVAIGWLGLPYNHRYLEALRPAFARLAETRAIVLRVMSGKPPDLGPVPVEYVPWREDEEATFLATLDIGIMPLWDDRWCRGKCAAKLLQYMAAGLPAVASDIGTNVTVIRHGINGLFARTTHDWHEHLARLADDVTLRTRLGAAARETVAKDYALSSWAEKLAQTYRDIGGCHRA